MCHQVCVHVSPNVCPLHVHSEMVNAMNFQGKTVDEALRLFQTHFQISVSAFGVDSSGMNCLALSPLFTRCREKLRRLKGLWRCACVLCRAAEHVYCVGQLSMCIV